MPKFNKTSTDKIIEKEQQSNTGIYVTAGDIDHSDYDDKDWKELQEDYVKMRNGHALISTTVDILKFPILMSEHRITGKNKEAEDFLYWVFDNLYKGFGYFKRHKMLALDFGLSLHEMVVKRGDKFGNKLTNRPIWFSPIQNETINKFYYDEQTRFTGIEHEKRTPEKGSIYIDINSENLEFFSFNEEFNDIRGRALLRPVRFYWESELKILTAKITSIQRGAGIPIIYTHGEPSSSDKATIEKIGRTICQLRNGYASANKDRVEIELVEPKGQQDILGMLEWLDRQMFFNTLSQFMTAGIGGNGSRAATSEHKSSYELIANFILQSLEENMQALCNRIIQMSHLKQIPEIEYPEFHFNAITQVDLQKVATNIKTLMDSSAITKQREDEQFIREMFGMPKLKITTEMADPQKKPVSIFESKVDNNVKLTKKENARKLSDDLMAFENRVFSLQSATDHYDTIEEKVNKIIEKKYNELFYDISFQLKKNRFKPIVIRNSLIEETIDELTKLYESGFNTGERDIKAEIKKIDGKDITNKLAISKKSFDKKRGIISKVINKLFFNTKTAVEIKMSKVSNEFIEKKGGLDTILTDFQEGFKRDKNNIKQEIESGYIDGRGETLLDLKDEIETFFISTRMDKSLCDECAPFDGLIVTYDEFTSMGLNFLHPVNPFCLGQDNCRCVILAYSRK